MTNPTSPDVTPATHHELFAPWTHTLAAGDILYTRKFYSLPLALADLLIVAAQTLDDGADKEIQRIHRRAGDALREAGYPEEKVAHTIEMSSVLLQRWRDLNGALGTHRLSPEGKRLQKWVESPRGVITLARLRLEKYLESAREAKIPALAAATAYATHGDPAQDNGEPFIEAACVVVAVQEALRVHAGERYGDAVDYLIERLIARCKTKPEVSAVERLVDELEASDLVTERSVVRDAIHMRYHELDMDRLIANAPVKRGV